jgi:pimeloyl-ACP methyl ester carboxylesterase
MSMFTKLPTQFYDATAFDGFSLDRDFRRGSAKAMAWLSQLSYETDEPKKIEDILRTWKLRLVDEVVSAEVRTVLPVASTHAFVAAGRGATFITFAGTDPVVLANWISDFDTHMTSTGVAEGYAKATSIVLDRIKDIATKRPNAEKKLFLCGHSLGGALAVVTASRLAANASTAVDAVYTFGMPRPGSGDFARDYNADLGMCTYRLVHGEDLVPTVAPSEMGFRHVGRYLHSARRGRFDQQDLVSGTLSDDPPFVKGVAGEIRAFLHSPFGAATAAAAQLRLAAEMALGKVPPGTRTDPGGILIELLPPRIRDHMPDRYCSSLA